MRRYKWFGKRAGGAHLPAALMRERLGRSQVCGFGTGLQPVVRGPVVALLLPLGKMVR